MACASGGPLHTRPLCPLHTLPCPHIPGSSPYIPGPYDVRTRAQVRTRDRGRCWRLQAPNRAGPGGASTLTDAQFDFWVSRYAALMQRTFRAAARHSPGYMVWAST